MEGIAGIISDIANFIGEMMGNMFFAIPLVAILVFYLVWVRRKK